MDSLTLESVASTLASANPNLLLDPTTVAYVHSLLAPYDAIISAATDLESIIAWVPTAFPEAINANIVETLKGLPADDLTNVSSAKTMIINYLVNCVRSFLPDMKDKMLFPWDALQTLNNSAELSFLTQVEQGHNKLPITVCVQQFGKAVPVSDIFTHDVGMEFMAGLFAFTNLSDMKMSVKMFETDLSPFGLVGKPDDNSKSRFAFEDEKTKHTYTIKCGNNKYTFDTPEFMKGLTTGAMWANVDHHTYWSELTTYSVNADGQEIPETLTL